MEIVDLQSRGFSRFRIERRLGSGHRGVVYAAYDTRQGQRVALKLLKRTDPSAILQFKREFRSLANVTHPNLVTLFELSLEGGRWFLTMELVEGIPFVRYVRSRSAQRAPADPESTQDPLTTTSTSPGIAMLPQDRDLVPRASATSETNVLQAGRLRPALRQLATALIALHRAGHLHRDIKPSNVLVTAEGRVVVLDFGIVVALRGSRAGDYPIAGTPAYMAPEQMRRQAQFTTRSDWYSFGVVLYEALTGRLPFSGCFPEMLRAKLDEAPAPPVDLAPEAPADLSALCLDLLDPDPDRRPGPEAILERLCDPALPDETTPGAVRLSSVPTWMSEVFVGRQHELNELAEALERVRGGAGLTVLLSGQSGIGKTALLQRFLKQVRREGKALVLEGRCLQGESLPYKALDSVVDALAEHLARIEPTWLPALMPEQWAALLSAFPVLARVRALDEARSGSERHVSPGHEDPRRALSGLRELLVWLAQIEPMVIAIDDLQWGDADSMPLLAELMAESEAPLLLVASYRSEQRNASRLLRTLLDWLEARADGQPVRKLELEPLSAADATLLATTLLRTVPGGKLDEADLIVREAHGSPYCLAELVRFVVACEAQGEATRELAALSLDTAITSRAEALSQAAREMLALVSVAGGRVTQRVLRGACSLGDAHQRAISELCAEQFVRSAGEDDVATIEVYHDRVREAVLQVTTRASRRDAHGRLARALELWGTGDNDHLFAFAHHAYEARDPDLLPRAFAANLEAAQTAASVYAYDQAHRFYNQARELARAARLRLDGSFYRKAGEVAARVGRLAEAMQDFQIALPSCTEPLARAEVRAAISKVYLGQLDSRAARGEIAAALRELNFAARGSSLRSLLRAALSALASIPLVNAAIRGEQRVRSEAERERLRCFAQLNTQDGLCAYFAIDRLGTLRSALSAVRAAASLGRSSELVFTLASGGAVAALLGLRRRARVLRAAAIQMSRKLGDPVASAKARAFAAYTAHFLGEPPRAQAAAELCLRRHGSWLENADYLTVVADLSWNLLMRGYAREAWGWIGRGLERAALAGPDNPLAQGHTYRCYAGPALAMLGRGEEGQRHLDAFKAFIRQVGATDPWRRAQHLSHQALCLVLAGELDDTRLEQLEQVVAEHRTLGLRPGRTPLQLTQFYVALGYARLTELQQISPTEARRHKRARSAARAALRRLAHAREHPTLSAHLRVLEAWYARQLGRRERARLLLERARRAEPRIDAPWIRYEIHRQAAHLELAGGDLPAARAHARAALALARDHGWTHRETLLQRELAEACSFSAPR